MRFFSKILLSLLACALLPSIAVAVVSSSIFDGLYVRMVSRSQMQRLAAVENATNILLDNFDQYVSLIAVNPETMGVGKYKNLSESMAESDFIAQYMRMMELLNYSARSIDLVDSTYYYPEESDYVVSSREGAVRLAEMTETAWLDKYAALRENPRLGRFVPAHPVYTSVSPGEQTYGRRCVTVVYEISEYIALFNGALAFNIYEDALLDVYTDGVADSNFALFDSDGTLITGVGSLDYSAVLGEYNGGEILSSSAVESGSFSYDTEGGQYLCVFSRSDDGRYIFLGMDNMTALMRERDRTQLISLAAVVLFVLLAAAIAYFISRRLYNPVEQMVKELRSGSKIDLTDRDEISAISRAVKDMLSEERQWFSDHSREKIKEATVMRLLSGETDADAGKIIPYGRSVCLLARIETGEAQKPDAAIDPRANLFAHVVAEEFAGSKAVATAIRFDKNTVAAIVNADESALDMEALITAKLPALRSASEEVLGRAATFAVGSLTDELAGVRESFDQARQALDCRYFEGAGSILCYDKVSADRREYYNAGSKIVAISRLLRSGGKNEVLAAMRGLAGDMRESGPIGVDNAYQILNLLAVELIRYADESEIMLAEVLGSGASLYQQLWDQPFFGDAFQWLLDSYAAVLDYQCAMEHAGNEHIRAVIDYVKANYTRGITIDSIAAHIGLSYSYLRKIFKDATGKNLADHINELRIKKAKELLRDTQYTVKEIAQMCGYSHERSFSRAFTQAENVPPGKYKEQAQAQVLVRK